jgi:uridine kinase
VREERDVPLRTASGVVILEGVVALAIPELLNRASFRIFVDVPDASRRERLADFYLGLKNITPEEFSAMMDEREEEEVPFIKSTRCNADVVYTEP